MAEWARESVVNYFDLEVSLFEVIDSHSHHSIESLEELAVLQFFGSRLEFRKVEHNIVEVDVSMHNLSLVDLIQSFGNFHDDALDFELFKSLFTAGDDVV